MQNRFLDSWASGDIEIDVCGCMCVHKSNGKVIQNIINTCRIVFWTAGRREISKSMSADQSDIMSTLCDQFDIHEYTVPTSVH